VRRGRAREIVLYVHLSDDALRSADPNTPVRVENAGGQLLTAGQVAEWCGRPDTDRITVKPVIDLAERLHSDGYQPSPRLADQVRTRDRTCVFPRCERPARSCDLDHVIPYDAGGSTSSDNLAPLCRMHHRLKTHSGWTYTVLAPGEFLWRSPYGYTYLRDRTGTTDLTPRPVPRPPDR
jgi:5-methylcytosine-specific restriction endonuclease McrA